VQDLRDGIQRIRRTRGRGRKMRKCGCHSHNGFVLRSEDSELAQRISLEGLTPLSDSDRVDSMVSVSASMDFELSSSDLENQYRRFLNGY